MMRRDKELKDVEGASIEGIYGERYRGWYVTKKFVETQNLPLNYKEYDLSYRFNIFDNHYRFVMPSKIEFQGGLITYSNGDRNLGMFRFPRDKDGDFVNPLNLNQKPLNLMELTKAETDDMLQKKPPLVFEAFKIPQYGFKLLDISGSDVQSIAKITDTNFSKEVKGEFDRIFTEKTNDILNRISSGPNFLLILQNMLDRQLKNILEVSIMTGGIIHT
jgi:hypothetical protein